MQKAGLDEAQGRIEIPGRNISNLRYAGDTTLMQQVHHVSMNVNEENENAGLNLI